MKQLIVLVSTVILGIAIGVMVMSFQTQAESVKGSVDSNIADIIELYEAPVTTD